MADLRLLTTEEGLFLRRDGVVAVLKEMGMDLLQHVPAHVEAGEYIEAALDRHADGILHMAADYFEKVVLPE